MTIDLFPVARQGLSTRRQLVECGLGPDALARRLRDGTLVRLRRGVYAERPLAPRSRHLLSGGQPCPAYVGEVRAVLLSLGPTAAARGRTAAVLWGLDQLVEPAVVEVLVGPGRTHVSLPGVTATTGPRQGVVLWGPDGSEALAVTGPLRTVVECLRDLPLREAVVVGDSALRTGLVDLQALEGWLHEHSRTPRSTRVRRVVGLVDPESGSVLESVLRLLLVEAGLTGWWSQYPVRTDAGKQVARVDFAWPGLRLVLECDGRRWHDPDDARARDRRRTNEVVRLGWSELRVTWSEVMGRPAYVVGLVRDALSARAAA